MVTAMVGLLQAMPRSRLYQRLAGEGRLRTESHGDNTSVVFNFEPRLDREFLIHNYRRLMCRLYEPGAYYDRIRIFLDAHRMRGPGVPPRPGPMWAPASGRRGSWASRTRGRRAYWRFVLSTLPPGHPDPVRRGDDARHHGAPFPAGGGGALGGPVATGPKRSGSPWRRTAESASLGRDTSRPRHAAAAATRPAAGIPSTGSAP